MSELHKNHEHDFQHYTDLRNETFVGSMGKGGD